MPQCPSCGSTINESIRFCPACGKAIQSPKQEPAEKQSISSPAKTTKHPMSKRAKVLYACIATALFSAFSIVFVLHIPGGEHPVIEKQPEIAMATMNTDVQLSPQQIEFTVDDGKVSFSLTELREKKLIAFDYHAENRIVPIMAFISTAGKLVTTIRLCEPCNSMSFNIEGNELACSKCETRWKLDNLEGIQGSCQKYPPDPIPSEVVGNFVVIKESAIKNWKMRI
jgi:uncharacterized membrane protein